VAFFRVDRPAGLMIVPYLLWLLLSTAINGWIVDRNYSDTTTPSTATTTATAADPRTRRPAETATQTFHGRAKR
ncbi:MAG: tryptophan-rich sensory protein, partial [Planctomycetota bacterium]